MSERVLITKAAKSQRKSLNSLWHKTHYLNKWLHRRSWESSFTLVTACAEFNALFLKIWCLFWSWLLYFSSVFSDGLWWLPKHEEIWFKSTSLFPLGPVVKWKSHIFGVNPEKNKNKSIWLLWVTESQSKTFHTDVTFDCCNAWIISKPNHYAEK